MDGTETMVLNSAGEGEYKSRKDIVNVVIADGVTEIADRAFYGCSSIKSVVIPGSVTKIGRYAFSGCKSLTNITYKGKIYSYDNIDVLYHDVNN